MCESRSLARAVRRACEGPGIVAGAGDGVAELVDGIGGRFRVR